jgi:hypothetical protein
VADGAVEALSLCINKGEFVGRGDLESQEPWCAKLKNFKFLR